MKRIPEDVCEKIIEEYKLGLSTVKVGKKYGVSYSFVYKLLKRRNTPIRSKSEAIRKYPTNDDYFSEIDTQDKAYILGMLYGDGCNMSYYDRGIHQVRLQLKYDDKEILEKIRDAIGTPRPIKEYTSNTGFGVLHSAILDITNKQQCIDLNRHGVVPQKTNILTYPETLNNMFLFHFLRGLSDSDGCIHDPGSRKYLAEICGTNSLMLSIQAKLEQYGVASKIYCGHSGAGFKPADVLCISGRDNFYRYMDNLYCDANLKMDRKYQRYLGFLELRKCS